MEKKVYPVEVSTIVYVDADNADKAKEYVNENIKTILTNDEKIATLGISTRVSSRPHKFYVSDIELFNENMNVEVFRKIFTDMQKKCAFVPKFEDLYKSVHGYDEEYEYDEDFINPDDPNNAPILRSASFECEVEWDNPNSDYSSFVFLIGWNTKTKIAYIDSVGLYLTDYGQFRFNPFTLELIEVP